MQAWRFVSSPNVGTQFQDHEWTTVWPVCVGHWGASRQTTQPSGDCSWATTTPSGSTSPLGAPNSGASQPRMRIFWPVSGSNEVDGSPRNRCGLRRGRFRWRLLAPEASPPPRTEQLAGRLGGLAPVLKVLDLRLHRAHVDLAQVRGWYMAFPSGPKVTPTPGGFDSPRAARSLLGSRKQQNGRDTWQCAGFLSSWSR